MIQLFDSDTLLAESGEIVWLESEQGYKVGGAIFVDTQRVFTVVDTDKRKKEVQQSLDNFAREKDFDGIGEASALLTSTNAEWAKDAATFVRLWDETWQAYEANTALPDLVW